MATILRPIFPITTEDGSLNNNNRDLIKCTIATTIHDCIITFFLESRRPTTRRALTRTLQLGAQRTSLSLLFFLSSSFCLFLVFPSLLGCSPIPFYFLYS